MPEHQTRLLAERYELISPLGRGTMGTVWRARDRALGREVAVKEIRQDPGLTEQQRAELRERMVREGRLAARINHTAVAAIHDVLIHDNSPWIIMELIEARSLEQVIDEEGPLPPRLVAEIGVDLLGALRAAHSQGITHRDVKPGNVLITETGRVVLTDFGIAKAEGDPKLTKTGMVIGSPGYTAPERARGEYTGPESDIWSLGATLYFAVEGRPAYERSTIAETLAALLSENADVPTQAGQLRPVLDGLLNKNYKKRLNAAKAETMLRMVADTPTSEMPVITAEALTDEESLVPKPPATPPGAAPGAPPQGRPPVGAPGQAGGPGAPSQTGRPAAAAPGRTGFPDSAPGRADFPDGAPGRAGRPPVGAPPGQGRPAGAPVQAGGPPAGAPGQAGPPAGAPGRGGRPPVGAPPGQGRPPAGAPAQQQPGWPQQESPAQGTGPAAQKPPAADPERTVSLMRPKSPLPQTPPAQDASQQGAPPQGPPPQRPGDESAVSTTRIHPSRPQNGSPGLQVYPPAQHPGQQGRPPGPMPYQGEQQMPFQQGPPPMGPPPERPDSHGLGTDLFSIASQPEPQGTGNRNGMLILMAVAAAAAVVIAILIVALLSS
ncbi:serine/threonine-protein kinase [Nonomuraea glycinis]|uniref:serine/threonine-protein kinase n=1 Tax=Nonomuraea glycinis TaxID=2047744 RepID=UPI0033BD3659